MKNAKIGNAYMTLGYMFDEAAEKGGVEYENLSDDISCYSDYYKDTHGVRPRNVSFDTVDQFKRAMKSLDEASKENDINEAKDLAENLAEFEDELLSIAQVMADYDPDPRYAKSFDVDALRWMTQSELFANEQEVETWVFNKGILFTPRGKRIVEILVTIWGQSNWGYTIHESPFANTYDGVTS